MYTTFYRPVFRYALAARGPDDADDVVSETFRKAYLAWNGRGVRPRSPLAWLLPKAKAVFKASSCGQPADALGCLAGTLLATKLNVANGSVSTCINSTVTAADDFLVARGYHGPGTYSLTRNQRKTALAYRETLAAYNLSGCP